VYRRQYYFTIIPVLKRTWDSIRYEEYPDEDHTLLTSTELG